jgi:hypothetical protein
MTLISQPGSDYQLAAITLDAGNARDITCLLIDVCAVLDHLWLDGTRPADTAPAEDYLSESASPYTLPSLIDALSDVITMLGHAQRETLHGIPPGLLACRPTDGDPPAPGQPSPQAGPDQRRTTAPRTAPGGAKSKEHSGARSG